MTKLATPILSAACGVWALTAATAAATGLPDDGTDRFTCRAIYAELYRVSERLDGLGQRRTGETAATALALAVFWPAALLIQGSDSTTHEHARLQGEFEALQRANAMKNCGIRLRPQGAA